MQPLSWGRLGFIIFILLWKCGKIYFIGELVSKRRHSNTQLQCFLKASGAICGSEMWWGKGQLVLHDDVMIWKLFRISSTLWIRFTEGRQNWRLDVFIAVTMNRLLNKQSSDNDFRYIDAHVTSLCCPWLIPQIHLLNLICYLVFN